MNEDESEIPMPIQFFMKQRNRFFMNRESTERNNLMFKIYLETLNVHPSDNPHEIALLREPFKKDPPIFENEFEILALKGDIQAIAERADQLVTIDFDEVRDPLTMLLGNKIRTRPGLTIDGILARPAADPSSVRELINKNPRPVTKDKIHYWLSYCSGRAIDYYKLNGCSIVHS